PVHDGGDFVDGFIERGFVRLRRSGGSANLAHELERGGANLLVGGWRLEVEQRLDVSAHESLRVIFRMERAWSMARISRAVAKDPGNRPRFARCAAAGRCRDPFSESLPVHRWP